MILIDGVMRHYAWGSPSVIPKLLGVPPTDRPVAELWFGAHPDSPSPTASGPLDEVIGADPARMLGERTIEQFGAHLPFLVKMLAVAEPLSLQVHPSREQAVEGYAREEAAGIPQDAPNRNYRDRNHKPELLRAMGEFVALCSFRPVAESVRLLQALGTPALVPLIARLPQADGLRTAVAWLLALPAAERSDLAHVVTAACLALESAGGDWVEEARWAARIGEFHPGDVGVVVALLLNLVHLQAGQAIYLPAGQVHCYLFGIGFEVMAASDNVLRCGLTPKHVDVPELMRVASFEPSAVEILVTGPDRIIATPAAEFRVYDVDPDAWVDAGSPKVFLARALPLRAMFLPADDVGYLRSPGILVTPNLT